MNSVSSPVLLARTHNAINLTSSHTAIGTLLPQVEDIASKEIQNTDLYLKLSGMFCTASLPVFDVYLHAGDGKTVLLAPLSFFGVQPKSSANTKGGETGIRVHPSLTQTLAQSLQAHRGLQLSMAPQDREQGDGHAVIEAIQLFAVPSCK